MRPSALALMLVATTLVATDTAAGPTEAGGAAASVPPVTRSWYVANGSQTAAVNLGCGNGDRGGRMTLFFGAPVEVDGSYGATLWSAPDQATDAIAETAKGFARGWLLCRQPAAGALLVGVGTSNSTVDGRDDAWLVGHGRAWAEMVRGLRDWADKYYPGLVRFYGAWDAEPSWSSVAKATRWMDGYDGLGNEPPLYAHFSADGCPRDRSDGGACNNGWDQESLWHLAWERDPALPIPQVYSTSGSNARQWHMIDRYGTARGDGIYFYGVLTQQAACRRTGDCKGTDNTPEQAHDQLLSLTNGDPATWQPSIDSLTDIDWHT